MAAVRRPSEGRSLPPDPSALEYARFHNICKDHRLGYPLDTRQFPPAPIFLSQELADPPGCPELHGFVSVETSERLDIDASAAAFLKFAAALPQELSEREDLPDRPRIRDLKIELPLLSSDHELDARRFRKRDPLRLQDITLPLEHTDEERDEGLSWPASSRTNAEKVESNLSSEKVQIPQDGLYYLQEVLCDAAKPESREDDAGIIDYHRKVPDPRPSSPTGRLEMLSEVTNSTAAEAETLEAELVRQDKLDSCDSAGLREFMDDPMLYDGSEEIELTELAPASNARKGAAELKVEVPLTPPSMPPSNWLSPPRVTQPVCFPDLIQTYVPETLDMPSNYENGNAVLDSDNDFDAFFENDIAPLAEQATRRIEQEQLQEVDTTMRVEVTVMDFSLPLAPWDLYSLKTSERGHGLKTETEAQRRLLSRCALEELRNFPRWAGGGKIEAALHWNPFPRNLLHTVPVETVQHQEELDHIIGSGELLHDSTAGQISTSWRKSSLTVFDDLYEETEDIAPWEFEPENDIPSLVQKRKSEISIPADDSFATQAAQEEEAPAKPSFSTRMKKTQQEPRFEKRQKTEMPETEDFRQPHEMEGSSIFGGLFSTEAALEQFMHVHSGIKRPMQPPKIVVENPNTSSRTATSNGNPPAQEQRSATSHPESRQLVSTSAPMLSLPSDLRPRSFITSSATLVQRRNLIRTVQGLYPDANLIERDLNRNNLDKIRFEADLILSPATGLLITTMQKIKQRPLPGQTKSQFISFQTQVARVAPSFEQLIVLVSEGQSSSPGSTDTPLREPDQRDCEALASLSGFVSNLDTQVTITYVPGGDSELACWIINTMVQYGTAASQPDSDEAGLSASCGQSFEVMPDETLWELLLVRAGFNSFAAQAVLARLGSSTNAAGPAANGIMEFVRMAHDERTRRLEKTLGGRKVLDKVGRRIDQWWG